jgi:soluble lytic murein transglycosylase-like protein
MYDLNKFQASIPERSRPYAQALINAAMKIPFQQIDAFLLCAIMERESGSGIYLTPPGPGGTGDSGNGFGLMQIDRRSHAQWLNANNWQDPETNITYGAEILRC